MQHKRGVGAYEIRSSMLNAHWEKTCRQVTSNGGRGKQWELYVLR